MKKVIATAHYTGVAQAIIPVIKRLNQEERLQLTAVAHGPAEKSFEEAKINYKTIKFWNFKEPGPESMEALLEQESPDLILTGASLQDKNTRFIIEQTITLAAKQKKIPTLAVLDSWTHYVRKFSDYFSSDRTYDPEYKEGRFRFLPDKIAVMDLLTTEEMTRLGFNPEILFITGNPHFDSIVEFKENFDNQERERIRKEFGFGLDDFLIYYASQPLEKRGRGEQLGYTEKTVLTDMLLSLERLRKDKNIGVLVGVHRGQDKHEMDSVIKGYSFAVKADQQMHPWSMVLSSEATVSPHSTTLVEALYLGKPAISFQPGLKIEDPLVINKLGVTVAIYEKEGIDYVLERLLFDYKNYSKELSKKREGFGIDGKATERVTKLVYDTLGLT